jgi:hypothetical protein
VVFAWVQPPPPDVPPQDGKPDFLGRPFSELNRWTKPLGPGKSVVGHHDAQPFTRFYGSIACDARLDISLMFSNDEVDADGLVVCDDNISSLNYDAVGVHQIYDPKKQEQTGKIFSLIFGHWIRVEVKNVDDREPTFIRLFLRGSVF